MEYYLLGKTDIKVSALCFGALPMGPLQANLSVSEGGDLLLAALQQGVNFIDTAEMYGTYPHIRYALERFRGDVVIASKSTAATYDAMHKAVMGCLDALGRDRIDIFHLHAARERDPIKTRAEALDALVHLKAAGKVRAVGVACHSVHGIRQAALDPRIDVIFPLINRSGLGILDGGVPEMLESIETAAFHGKGLYAMKALGGGNLLSDVPVNFDFVRSQAKIPVIAVGMVRQPELAMNLALFSGETVTPESNFVLTRFKKTATVVSFLCKGCATCINQCHNDALSMQEGKATIDRNKCLLCGYCAPSCPQFAIRVI